MSSLLPRACAALLLAALSSSCVLALGTGDSEHRLSKSALNAEAGKAGTVAASGDKQQDGKAAPNADAVAKKAARKAEKKAREITYAQMELALAKMDAERELTEATHGVEHTHHDQEAAQRELDHFLKTERPMEMEDQQLDVDRSTEQALEQKQELDELKNMYKADDFAKMTKELVLQRGKTRMEFAQRELELTKKRAADKQAHDWAVKEHDLSLALKKANDEVGDAEAKLKKTQAHNELDLMRAQHKLEDAQRGDEDDDEAGEKGPADPKGA